MRDIIERLRERRLDSECIDPDSYCCGSDCECQLEDIEEAADEIERLREALRQCYVLFNDARNGPPNLFKICCEGMRVVRAENVLGRGNG